MNPGAIWSTRFFTVLADNSLANILLFETLLFLAIVIHFSATILNSFAFASVVFIFPCKKRLVASVLKSAVLWFFGLDNILPLFLFRICLYYAHFLDFLGFFSVFLSLLFETGFLLSPSSFTVSLTDASFTDLPSNIMVKCLIRISQVW